MAGDGAFALLRKPDFRRLYLAVAVSELGDALHYIAIMWIALATGGPMGVTAVRLADSVPAILFGFHGGLVADRLSPKRVLIAADLVRGAVLVPIAVLGLRDRLPLAGLVAAAFVLETATSYFGPAYGVMLPAVAERRNVQAANGLVRATASAVSIGGWALAAGLLAALPMSVFFALNAASFFLSAALLATLDTKGRPEASAPRERPRLREGFAAVRNIPGVAVGVVGLGLGVTLATGSWIGGVPDLVRSGLGGSASGFAIVMIGYAVGSIGAGIVLAHRPARNKARASLLAWAWGLPGFLLLATAGSLWTATAGGVFAGAAQTSAVVLLNSAAQSDAPDAVLGRVSGLISLVHRGAHATALIFVAPLYAVFAPRNVFASVAVALALLAAVGALVARSPARPARNVTA